MRSIGLFLLGCLDVAVGSALILKHPIAFLAYFSIGKGVWSIFLSSRDVLGLLLGLLDLIGGIFLLFPLPSLSLVNIIGFSLIGKGIYSIIFSL